MSHEKILVVAAHPDDEILGCGATVARLIAEGHSVKTIICAQGVLARVDNATENDDKSLQELKQQALKANAHLGVDDLEFLDFPDNKMDSVPLLDIVKELEKIMDSFKPTQVFTHFSGDLNIDHQKVAQAVSTATRPLPGSTVKKVYSFEVLSSTEWAPNSQFEPNTFFDVSSTIEKKVAAMAEYKMELRDFPHPRSLEGLKSQAQLRGLTVGKTAAEAFMLVRDIQ